VAGAKAALDASLAEIDDVEQRVGLEVTDAQTALAEALTNQAQATYNCQVAQARLRRAMGLLPDEELSAR